MPRIDEFEDSLERIPWFAHIGKPLDPTVARLGSWSEWPGPEAEECEGLGEWQQELHDSIIGPDEKKSNPLGEIFLRVRERVIELASSCVPYDPDQDWHHAPTMAVWHAAWTAGLMALCISTGRSIPPGLVAQWAWFVRGHWPAAFATPPGGRHLDDVREFRVL